MENNNVNALDELNKGACMGMDAIDFILDKVSNDDFRKAIEKQYNDYKHICKRIEREYPKFCDGEPHETSALNKVATWYGVEMKTLIDKSDSKIAELLLQGTNMGIIEGRKMLNNKDVDENIKDLINDYVSMQERAVEDLKKFL